LIKFQIRNNIQQYNNKFNKITIKIMNNMGDGITQDEVNKVAAERAQKLAAKKASQAKAGKAVKKIEAEKNELLEIIGFTSGAKQTPQGAEKSLKEHISKKWATNHTKGVIKRLCETWTLPEWAPDRLIWNWERDISTATQWVSEETADLLPA